jgi:thiamine-monophosphate kinase
MKLGDLGEDSLLDEIAVDLARGNTRKIFGGLRDDCAIVQMPDAKNLVVLKTDCVVEEVHFVPETKASHVGWKAMMRPLSDFAAASAVPRFALITLIAPRETEVAWVKELYCGLRKSAEHFDVTIVGGETSSTPGPIAVSVSVIGFVEHRRAVSRRGGRPGDKLFVTGRLGGGMKQKHLKFVPRIVESRWLTQHFCIHAMMDLSDGLGADLPRLARDSNVGFNIDVERLPLARGATVSAAIAAGEDYELLFAISPRDEIHLANAWRRKFPKLSLTRIGSLSTKSKSEKRKLPLGYIHFQQRS